MELHDASEETEHQIEDETAYENVLKYRIKPIGKWQWFILLLLTGPSGAPMVIFPAFTSSINIPHRCRIPQLNSSSLTYDQVTNLTIPFKESPDLPPVVGQVYQPCLQYDTTWLDDLLRTNKSLSFQEMFVRMPSRNQSEAFECKNGVEFYKSKPEFRGSVVETFNMVCERSQLAPLSNTVYLISQTIACLTTGYLSDRFGRKPVVVIFGWIMMLSALLVSFSVNIYMFYIFRMLIGFCAITVPVTGFILLAEITDSTYRNLFTALSSTAFGFGFSSGFVVFAYIFQNWRYLHGYLWVLTLPSVLYPFFLCESPRWLFTRGRGKEAVAVIQRAIQLNNPEAKLSEEEERQFIAKMPVAKIVNFKDTVLQAVILFKSREMLRRTFILAFVFFSHGMIYYGTTFYSVKLRGNRYLMFWAVCVIAIPANLMQFVLYHKFNRKKPLIGLTIITIPIFIAVIIYQIVQSSEASVLPVIIGTTLGKMIVDATFSMMYVYTPELYPTEARNAGLGTVSAFSRVGAATAPFIIRLSNDVWRPLPFIFFVVFATVYTLILLYLPETKNKPLFDTVEQLERHRLEKDQRQRNRRKSSAASEL